MKAQRRPDGSYSPPFSVRSLDNNCRDSSDVPPSDDKLLSLLPASYRTESDDLVASSCAVEACVKKELDLQRLTDILNWLWIAGRPMPPRPLHYQLLLSRDIFAKERIDMHLVWTTGRIFLKPLPRFLLEPRFWTPHLSCDRSCRCPAEEDAPRSPGGVPTCEQKKLWKGALGFLFSYAALITHETDFWIAKEKLLLPPEVSWSDWRTLVLQLDTEHIYARIDPRFIYGELRLSLLNKIYYLSRTPLRATCLAGSGMEPFSRITLRGLHQPQCTLPLS